MINRFVLTLNVIINNQCALVSSNQNHSQGVRTTSIRLKATLPDLAKANSYQTLGDSIKTSSLEKNSVKTQLTCSGLSQDSVMTISVDSAKIRSTRIYLAWAQAKTHRFYIP